MQERASKRWMVLLPPLLAALAMGFVWEAFDLGALRSIDQVVAAIHRVRAEPWAPAYVIAGYAAFTVMFVPITALIVGTALAFGPYEGALLAFGGVCVGACTTYWAGRLLGSEALTQWTGPRVARLAEALRLHAFRASFLARMAPVGNFAAMNMLAGSLRVPFWLFFAGTALGAAPGVAFFTFFSERAAELLRGSNRGQGLVWLIALTVLAGALWAFRRWWLARRA